MRKIRKQLAIAAFTTAWLAAFGPILASESRSDKETLEEMIAAFGRNVESIKSWKGQAQASRRGVISSADIEKSHDWLTEWSVGFACELPESREGSYRYDIDIYKSASITQVGESPRLRPERRLGIFHNGKYATLTYKTDSPNAARMANVEKVKPMGPGFHYGTFEPTFFFTLYGTWPDDYWKVLIKKVDAGAFSDDIDRNGSVVTILQERGGARVVRDLDLAKGGNYVSYSMSEQADAFKKDTTIKWDWVEIEGCWVPSRVVFRSVTTIGGDEDREYVEIEWKEHSVNYGPDESEFLLPKLGLRVGDTVTENESGRDYRVTGPELPPNEVKQATGEGVK